DGCRVHLRFRTVDGGDYRQRLRCRRGDDAYVPQSCARGVGAPAGGRRYKRQATGQQIGHLHTGGDVGASVAQCDGEGKLVADIGRGVAHRLRQCQVGFRGRYGGVGLVVVRVRVERVGVVDRGRIRLWIGADHPGDESQGWLRGDNDGAHVPFARVRLVAPLAGGGRHQGETCGQTVLNGDAAGIV